MKSITTKDIIQIVVLMGSLLIAYMTTIKDHEIRISILESESTSAKEDLREIKRDIKKLLAMLGKR